MSPMCSPVVALLFSLFLVLSAADAFNITEILSPYPDFATFNNYLIRTGVAGEINSEQTVTVLVVADDKMSAVSGKWLDAIKRMLSVHVILDYFDAAKLQHLPAKPITLTTLYQKSGHAQYLQGFLNVTLVRNGSVVFGSAAPCSNPDSIFVKTVSSQPYSISVLQISNVINVGSNSTTQSSPPASGPAVSPTNPPDASPPRKALAPAPSPSHKESPAASPSNQSNAASPAASPPNPSNATAPSADTPAGSPSNPVADGPAGSDNESSAMSLTSGNYLLASIPMIFTSAWFLLTTIG
ncbi:fasciclin-like arabinogalactan protein 14 [Durio zibethinus]|uniref:Fasciclin-like arabinogalactan protein 14 n=1 Tax=Durio zibethinus TaxID=66656 RepID=A0A6P5X8F1_DURZI|nr:fasciclin-like arabinogalactan protein 14 [Durio zibethinus]